MTDKLDEDFELMFDTPYVRAIELRGKDLDVFIEKVDPRVKIVGDGGKVDYKPVLHFRGAGKPMVCNVTNGRTIGKMYGRAARGWQGKWITIFPTVDKGRKCIRVRPVVPKRAQQQQPSRQRQQPPPVPPRDGSGEQFERPPRDDDYSRGPVRDGPREPPPSEPDYSDVGPPPIGAEPGDDQLPEGF